MGESRVDHAVGEGIPRVETVVEVRLQHAHEMRDPDGLGQRHRHDQLHPVGRRIRDQHDVDAVDLAPQVPGAPGDLLDLALEDALEPDLVHRTDIRPVGALPSDRDAAGREQEQHREHSDRAAHFLAPLPKRFAATLSAIFGTFVFPSFAT